MKNLKSIYLTGTYQDVPDGYDGDPDIASVDLSELELSFDHDEGFKPLGLINIEYQVYSWNRAPETLPEPYIVRYKASDFDWSFIHVRNKKIDKITINLDSMEIEVNFVYKK